MSGGRAPPAPAAPAMHVAAVAVAAAAAVLALAAAPTPYSDGGAWAQAPGPGDVDIRLATYQETAQVIIDTAAPGSVTASITLQSTSGQEIRVPPGLEDMLLADGRVVAVVVTNEDSCVLGVPGGQSCVMVNVKRDPGWSGIRQTQDEARAIGMSYIGGINSLLDIDARFHSVFIHHRDEANVALGTSGVVSGRNTVSAVFTMPMESTDSMFEKSSAILLARPIRDAGGFYDAARSLSADESAKMSFSMLPSGAGGGALYQLKVSAHRPGAGPVGPDVSPLEYLGADTLRRSDYFSQAFYPLNSIVQVVAVGNATIGGGRPGTVETETRNGVDVPADLGQAGWMIGGEGGGGRSEAVFLFGRTESIGAGEMSLTIGGGGGAAPEGGGGWGGGAGAVPEGNGPGYGQIAAAAAAVAAAGGAAAFFLRGYKRAPGSSE